MYKYFIILLFLPFLLMGQNPDHSYRNLEAIKLWKMAEYLELSSDQMASIITYYREYSEIKKDLNDERNELIDILRQIISGHSTENIEGIIADIIEIDDELNSIKFTERDVFFDLLTPLQQGKFFIFQIEFAKEMRRFIHDIGGNRRP